MAINLMGPISPRQRVLVLVSCAAAVAGLSIAERFLGREVPLGGFFLLPIVVAASFVSRWSILGLAIMTALARESIGAFAWGPASAQRLTLSIVAFSGVGLFAGELVRNRRMTVEVLEKTREEANAREQAERDIRSLIESTPVGVITVEATGKIAMANAAARHFLGFETGSPEGDRVDKYMPVVGRLLKAKQLSHLTRTMLETSVTRRNGETFFSQAWISGTNEDGGSRRLTIFLSDITEQIRDREESGLRQLLSNSRIVAGAVSHELRNLAATASVLHLNLGKKSAISDNQDYQALGTVLESILKLSSTELSDASEQVHDGLNVADLLGELRTIITPSIEEAGITAEWDVAPNLPPVKANHTGLLQVFLNLTKNSRAALRDTSNPRIRITAYELGDNVVVRVCDNGPGVSTPERLFQPFQPGASSTGLGLFVSRAIIRTFGGELHHTQPAGECCFVVEIPSILAKEAER